MEIAREFRIRMSDRCIDVVWPSVEAEEDHKLHTRLEIADDRPLKLLWLRAETGLAYC